MGKIHLVFDQFHHGLARREEVDGRKLMLRKNRRDLVRLAQQSVIIGAGSAPDVQPCGIVMTQQLYAAFLKGISMLYIRTQRKPPCEEITAKRHVHLPVALDLGIGVFQLDVRVHETALHERRLRPHDGFRPLPVAIGDFIVVGHTLVHLCKLALQLARRTIVHHQSGRRVKGPAAAFLDAEGKAGHLAAGAAMQAAHGADIIIA